MIMTESILYFFLERCTLKTNKTLTRVKKMKKKIDSDSKIDICVDGEKKKANLYSAAPAASIRVRVRTFIRRIGTNWK